MAAFEACDPRALRERTPACADISWQMMSTQHDVDIEMVMKNTGLGRAAAAEALASSGLDAVETVMMLGQKRNFHPSSGNTAAAAARTAGSIAMHTSLSPPLHNEDRSSWDMGVALEEVLRQTKCSRSEAVDMLTRTGGNPVLAVMNIQHTRSGTANASSASAAAARAAAELAHKEHPHALPRRRVSESNNDHPQTKRDPIEDWILNGSSTNDPVAEIKALKWALARTSGDTSTESPQVRTNSNAEQATATQQHPAGRSAENAASKDLLFLSPQQRSNTIRETEHWNADRFRSSALECEHWNDDRSATTQTTPASHPQTVHTTQALPKSNLKGALSLSTSTTTGAVSVPSQRSSNGHDGDALPTLSSWVAKQTQGEFTVDKQGFIVQTPQKLTSGAHHFDVEENNPATMLPWAPLPTLASHSVTESKVLQHGVVSSTGHVQIIASDTSTSRDRVEAELHSKHNVGGSLPVSVWSSGLHAVSSSTGPSQQSPLDQRSDQDDYKPFHANNTSNGLPPQTVMWPHTNTAPAPATSSVVPRNKAKFMFPDDTIDEGDTSKWDNDESQNRSNNVMPPSPSQQTRRPPLAERGWKSIVVTRAVSPPPLEQRQARFHAQSHQASSPQVQRKASPPPRARGTPMVPASQHVDRPPRRADHDVAAASSVARETRGDRGGFGGGSSRDMHKESHGSTSPLVADPQRGRRESSVQNLSPVTPQKHPQQKSHIQQQQQPQQGQKHPESETSTPQHWSQRSAQGVQRQMRGNSFNRGSKADTSVPPRKDVPTNSIRGVPHGLLPNRDMQRLTSIAAAVGHQSQSQAPTMVSNVIQHNTISSHNRNVEDSMTDTLSPPLWNENAENSQMVIDVVSAPADPLQQPYSRDPNPSQIHITHDGERHQHAHAITTMDPFDAVEATDAAVSLRPSGINGGGARNLRSANQARNTAHAKAMHVSMIESTSPWQPRTNTAVNINSFIGSPPKAMLMQVVSAVNKDENDDTEQVGIGALFRCDKHGRVVVSAVKDGGVSNQHGVMIDDVVLDIDGIVYRDHIAAAAACRGPVGTMVTMRFMRERTIDGVFHSQEKSIPMMRTSQQSSRLDEQPISMIGRNVRFANEEDSTNIGNNQPCELRSEARHVEKVGVGALFGEDGKGRVLVTALAENGPAMRKSINVGDVIVSVDGVHYDNAVEAAAACKGPVGETVTLGIANTEFEQPINVVVMRAQLTNVKAVFQRSRMD